MNQAAIIHNHMSWHTSDIEPVTSCPFCESSKSTTIHADLQDYFFNTPGTWQMLQCDQCQSAYLSPRPTASSIIKAYDNYYTRDSAPKKLGPKKRSSLAYMNALYIKRSPLALFLGKFILRKYTRRLARRLHFLPNRKSGNKRILDYGCGAGAYLETVRDLGWSTTGVEFDPLAVAYCQSRGLNVLHTDAVNSFPAASFDFITLNHVLEHVHQPQELVQTCYQLLTPNGQLFIELPNILSHGHRIYGRYWRGLECPRHLSLPTTPVLVKLLKDSGFSKVEIMRDANPLEYIRTSSEAVAPEIKGSFLWPKINNFFSHKHREFISVMATKGV